MIDILGRHIRQTNRIRQKDRQADIHPLHTYIFNATGISNKNTRWKDRNTKQTEMCVTDRHFLQTYLLDILTLPTDALDRQTHSTDAVDRQTYSTDKQTYSANKQTQQTYISNSDRQANSTDRYSRQIVTVKNRYTYSTVVLIRQTSFLKDTHALGRHTHRQSHLTIDVNRFSGS